jgi:hypothetical protein
LGDAAAVGLKRHFGCTGQRRSLARQVYIAALLDLHRVSACKRGIRDLSFIFIVKKGI